MGAFVFQILIDDFSFAQGYYEVEIEENEDIGNEDVEHEHHHEESRLAQVLVDFSAKILFAPQLM